MTKTETNPKPETRNPTIPKAGICLKQWSCTPILKTCESLEQRLGPVSILKGWKSLGQRLGCLSIQIGWKSLGQRLGCLSIQIGWKSLGQRLGCLSIQIGWKSLGQRSGCLSILKGWNLSAQGCEERATLGIIGQMLATLKGLYLPAVSRSLLHFSDFGLPSDFGFRPSDF